MKEGQNVQSAPSRIERCAFLFRLYTVEVCLTFSVHGQISMLPLPRDKSTRKEDPLCRSTTFSPTHNHSNDLPYPHHASPTRNTIPSHPTPPPPPLPSPHINSNRPTPTHPNSPSTLHPSHPKQSTSSAQTSTKIPPLYPTYQYG